ncbi:MAG: hypothetical protein Q4B54_07235 [Coriobacteriales bacterium]|nr:hypothetical protein [Coriobacteriales bacterium]
MRNIVRAVAGAVLALTAAIAAPAAALAADTQPMYRLYNPNGGEHFYTASAGERTNLVNLGWKNEGEGWTAPTSSNTPVFRLYNPNGGDHHYTKSAGERDLLVAEGWKSEGIGWYSDDAMGVPLYRQYNPNAKTGSHNYTTSLGENNALVAAGWRAEGIGWYGVANGDTSSKGLDIQAQLDLIRDKRSEWEFTHGSDSSVNYVVCDINHDNHLEILAEKFNVSLHATESKLLEVNSDGTSLVTRFTTGSILNTLWPDWTSHWDKSAWPTINIETYVSGEKHAYLVRDYLHIDSDNFTDQTLELLVDGDSFHISKVRSYTKAKTALLNITKEFWRDGNNTEISEDEYNQIVTKRYAGWEKKNTALNWISESELSSDISASLKKSWDGFKLL